MADPSGGGLDRASITTLLAELNDELARRGARADLFLVGGAALALAYDATRSTRDLDAVFLPTEVVRSAASTVAERHGLASDWLNDAVKGFLPGPDPAATRYFDSEHLRVDIASARYLLAMKLFASRVESDAEDILFLYREVGFSTVDEGLDLLESAYSGRPIDPKVQYLLQEIVESLGQAPRPDRAQPDAARSVAAAAALERARRLGARTEDARQRMLSAARARRAAILDAHRGGLSVRQIAQELGCSPAVVQEALRSARTDRIAGPDGADDPRSAPLDE
jgi:DNA-binding NarL/FixJ family response regulator